MNFSNYSDVVSQLKGIGLIPSTVTNSAKGVATGELYYGSSKPVRCAVENEGSAKRGWYWLHDWEIEPGTYLLVGTYGIYRGDDPGTNKIDLTKTCTVCGHEMGIKEPKCPACGKRLFRRRELSNEQQEALKARMAEDRKRAEEDRKKEIEQAAQRASAVWRKCREARIEDHDYLSRKQLAVTGGVRIFESLDDIMLEGAEPDDYKYLAKFLGALVVPMCDPSGRVCGLQFILSREKHAERIKRNERDKDYWPEGLEKLAHYWLIGGTPTKVCLIVEGYATGISLHMATGLPVVVAFDAGNLITVAQALHKHYRKRIKFLLCADDDWLQTCDACRKPTTVATEFCVHCGKPHRKGNAGIARAGEAALAVDGAWVIPHFAKPRPETRKGPTDFNDLHALEGLQVVRAQIEQKLAALEWGAIPPAHATAGRALGAERAGASPGGGGGNGRKERPKAQSVMLLDDAVERFVPLDDGTGKYLFDQWTNKFVLKDQMQSLLPAGVRWDAVKMHPTWSMRGAYYMEQVGFDPTEKDPGVQLNTWRGWPMEPVAGKCELLLSTLEYFCGNEDNRDEVFQWVLRWMAYPLQHPGAKMASAIILHGPQGTGKSLVFQALSEIYGDYATVLNQRGLEDKFNSDWSDSKLFILAEEVVTRADLYHIKNELKELVTGKWIRINPKNIAAYRQRNQLNIVYSSNETQPLPIENDDRRHCVIWTPPPLPKECYDDVLKEMAEGGIAALYHYLLNLDLGDFHPHKGPPMTEAKRDLIALSMPSEERFIREWQTGETGLPFCPCKSMHLYAAYRTWCTANGVRFPRESNQFLGQLRKLNGWTNQPRHIYTHASYIGNEKKSERMVIPSPEALEAAKKAGHGLPRNPTQDQAEWLTNGFFTFKNALESAHP